MAQATFGWTLTAFQQHGTLWLQWNTSAPFRAQQGQILVYNTTSFPSNPQDNVKTWAWDDNSQPWNTGLPWGSNWCCSRIAQASANGPYVYFLQLTTTGISNPESLISE